MKTIDMPFGVKIFVENKNAQLARSDLAKELMADDQDALGKAAADALESFLLALAAEGVDLGAIAYKKALQTSVEAIANELG